MKLLVTLDVSPAMAKDHETVILISQRVWAEQQVLCFGMHSAVGLILAFMAAVYENPWCEAVDTVFDEFEFV